MASYVYIITNKINNKCYIGKTKNKNTRWSQHKSLAKSKRINNYFYNSLRKYGVENFSFEIVKSCDTEEESYDYERLLIKLFDTRNKEYGYNNAEGGRGSKGYKVKEELKEYFHDKYVGSKSIRAKFTDQEVITILDEYSTENWTCKQLSQKYNCSKATIINVISGTTYSDIEYDRSKFKDIGYKNKYFNKAKGEAVKTCKLSDIDVKTIRDMYATGKYSYTDLAVKFNVTKTNIHFIIKNKSRKI